jgi:AcrR family transcriptional regulator
VPRMGLTPAKVVASAAELADRDGLGGLSLSELAQTLGVRVPSLYKHVAGLDDLLDRLRVEASAALSAALRRAATGKRGRDALLAVGVAYRRFARSHPGQYEAAGRIADPDGAAPAAGSSALDDVLADVVSDYGYVGAGTVHAARAVRSALDGFVRLERTGAFGSPAGAEPSFFALLALLDRGLTPATEPARRIGFRLPSIRGLSALPGLGR